MQFQNFLGGSATMHTASQSAETCINLYPEISESPGAKNTLALYGTPGLRRYALLLESYGVRGLFSAANGRVFVVCGRVLFEIFQGGSIIIRGTLLSRTGAVSFAENALELIIVDGTEAGYLFTLASNTFAVITDPNFDGGDRVVAIDGYFILNRRGTDQFYISGLNDGSTYDATAFSTADARPDRIVSLLEDHRELWVFGERSIEPYFNSGNIDFPFERIQGTLIEQGCAAAQSPARFDNSVAWLGRNDQGQGMVWRADGYTPIRISTHAVELAMQGYARLDDAIGYTEQREGHTWYVLSFPTGNATWVYDAASQLWHQRASLNTQTGQFQVHLAHFHCVGFGLHLVGSPQSATVYSSEFTSFTDDTMPILRERTAAYIHQDRRLLYHALFELDMETGVGLQAGQGSLPQIMMQFSDDSGHTWSHEQWATAGAQGEYLRRAIWRRLGRSRQRAYRIRITDPVKVALVAARIEVA